MTWDSSVAAIFSTMIKVWVGEHSMIMKYEDGLPSRSMAGIYTAFKILCWNLNGSCADPIYVFLQVFGTVCMSQFQPKFAYFCKICIFLYLHIKFAYKICIFFQPKFASNFPCWYSVFFFFEKFSALLWKILNPFQRFFLKF